MKIERNGEKNELLTVEAVSLEECRILLNIVNTVKRSEPHYERISTARLERAISREDFPYFIVLDTSAEVEQFARLLDRGYHHSRMFENIHASQVIAHNLVAAVRRVDSAFVLEFSLRTDGT